MININYRHNLLTGYIYYANNLSNMITSYALRRLHTSLKLQDCVYFLYFIISFHSNFSNENVNCFQLPFLF